MASRSYTAPATFVTPEGTWPHGPLDPHAPTYARVCAALVSRLREHMTAQGLSLRAVANPAGIDPTSLSRLVTGKVVPDLATIANLEEALGIDLWPGRL